MKITRLFLYSAGVILAFTGIAKMWSGFGNVRLLAEADPILSLSFRHLMIAAGTLELIIAGVCLLGKSKAVASILIAWLGTSLLAYRLGLRWLGWHRPCSCLGNFTDALHISPQSADLAMKFILAYLLIGGYATLFWLWRQKCKAPPVAPSLEKPAGSAA